MRDHDAMRMIPMTPEQCRAVAAADRIADCAADFPQPGDRLIAAAYVEAPTPTIEQPWGMWLVVEGGLAVGTVCLKHPPDPDGRVEIGYGIAPSVRNRGLASEAVATVIRLAMAAGARTITADTDVSNIASITVLARQGFSLAGQDSERLWWQLSP